MAQDVIVRPSAEADARSAASWYEKKREGIGAEFTLELDALFDRIAQNPRSFLRSATVRGEPCYTDFRTPSISSLQKTCPSSSRYCINIADPSRGEGGAGADDWSRCARFS